MAKNIYIQIVVGVAVTHLVSGEHEDDEFDLWPDSLKCNACDDFTPTPKELCLPIAFWFRTDEDKEPREWKTGVTIKLCWSCHSAIGDKLKELGH